MLSVLMVLSAFAEIFSIGAVFPFLGVLTSPSLVFNHPIAQPIILILGINNAQQLLLPVTLVFGLGVLIAGTMRILLLWATTRISFTIGAEISSSIYRRTLYQPYMVHCARNSSEVIDGIMNKASTAITIINMVLVFMGSVVTIIAILFALVAVAPVIALATFGGLGLIYSVIVLLNRNRLLINSQITARESTNVIKSLQEGLGGIRDVLIDGSQATYFQIYRRADLPLRRVQASNAFISASPRYGIEALGMLLIAGLAFSIAQEADGIARAIPILGALAMGAQRLLPVLQQAYAAWSYIMSGQASLQGTLELLDQPLPDYAYQPTTEPLPFREKINLNNIAFRYSSETPWVLSNLDLSIAKGSRVGFIGVTGSGKSTLLDIVMGLLQPTKGTIEIDGELITIANNRAWQAHIAHVPQAIFLADGTIEENIAFGVTKEYIDRERVKFAAQQAQIAENIDSWPNQYETIVGERGIRLSGGQRQRIGIARALYKRADVIIFDEATSALDSETEHTVMEAIEGLSENLTLLIIAHRITTLKNCSQIIELGEGGIKRIGSYDQIMC
jgi:ABC-type multidrug transport system fused ATPase/permease subunit